LPESWPASKGRTINPQPPGTSGAIRKSLLRKRSLVREVAGPLHRSAKECADRPLLGLADSKHRAEILLVKLGVSVDELAKFGRDPSLGGSQ
jgi:hypothetical protein